MIKEESRYFRESNFGQEDLNQTATNILIDELNKNGIESVDRIYASVVQKPKFEQFKQSGIYPTTGNCLCNLKYYKCQMWCRGLGMTLDHGELWYKNNKPYKYVAQPYVVDKKGLEKLNQICNEQDLDYKIFGNSFHFSGDTFLIEIYKRENN